LERVFDFGLHGGDLGVVVGLRIGCGFFVADPEAVPEGLEFFGGAVAAFVPAAPGERSERDKEGRRERKGGRREERREGEERGRRRRKGGPVSGSAEVVSDLAPVLNLLLEQLRIFSRGTDPRQFIPQIRGGVTDLPFVLRRYGLLVSTCECTIEFLCGHVEIFPLRGVVGIRLDLPGGVGDLGHEGVDVLEGLFELLGPLGVVGAGSPRLVLVGGELLLEGVVASPGEGG
jgi:hypothetical protein